MLPALESGWHAAAMRSEMAGQPGRATSAMWLAAAVALAVGLAPRNAAANPEDEPLRLDVAALLQIHGTLTESGSPDGNNWAGDAFVRRARILLDGQVGETFKFFFGTVHANFGKGGNNAVDVSTADAWVEYDAGPVFKLDAGLLMIPFLHNMRQSGASILTIDWHIGARRYPVTAQIRGRDYGIGARGIALDNKVSYHLHLMRGTWAGDGAPRLTGRLSYNLFDAETGYFLAGTYLGKKKIVSFGLAADLQPSNGGLDTDGELTTYVALGGDVFIDLPLGPNGVTAQVNAAYYRDSIANAPGASCTVADLTTCASFSGFSVLSEFGYRFGQVGPVVGLDWVRPRGADSFDDHTLRLLGGVNYWIRGHAANVKLEVSHNKQAGGDFADGVTQLLVQGQAFIK